ncbi:MAG: SurA N-terminal domain-containing protein [Bacteroidetes bacterium]|nr:SurA N-terminal domain-containing protein [Bacteroidota bacterium]
MAALNTLRTKGGIVLSIFIGVALLAFLLGDWDRMGQQKSIVIGTVNGDKIDYQQFNDLVDEITNAEMMLSGSSSLSVEQTDKVQKDAWQQTILKNVVLSSFEELGVVVSDQEMVDMTMGGFISPILRSIFVNSQGLFDEGMMKNFIANLDMDQSGRARIFWTYIEAQMSKERAMSKYTKLVSSSIYITNLEAERSAVEANTTVNVDYISQATTSIPDSLVEVSDLDMKVYYVKNFKRFKKNEGRELRYVVFEATPSDDDYTDGKEHFETLNNEFLASNDAEQFVNLNSETSFSPRYVGVEKLPKFIFADNSKVSQGQFFGPSFDNDVYTSLKVISKKNLPDSVTLRFTFAPATINADSLVKEMNRSSAKFDVQVSNLIAKVPSVKPANVASLNTSDLDEEMINKISETRVGKVVYIKRQDFYQIVKVEKKGKIVPKVQIAELIYTVLPSPQTEQVYYNLASNFVNSVSDTKSFNTKAQDEAILVRTAPLNPQSKGLDGIDNSRELARWAFTNEQNAVSHVVSIGSKNIVACLAKVSHKGTSTIEEVKEQVKYACISEKKNEMIAENMTKAGSIDAIASENSSTIESVRDVNFNSFYLPNLGVAPEFIGAVTSVAVDAQTKPIVSASKVYMAKVTSKVTTEDTDVDKQHALLEARAQSNVYGRVIGSLITRADIVDERVLYF